MHHRTDTDGCENLYLCVVFLKYLFTEVCVTVLQTEPDSLNAVGPQSINQLVFPVVAALCDDLVFRVDQHGLNTGRAKLDTENGFT